MRTFLIFSFLLFFSQLQARKISTFYGDFDVQEPAFLAVIYSEPVTRLKGVNQYGTVAQFYEYHYDRYEHSVGVAVLLRMFGASLTEQVAGLLHDVSHTVFSHVGDHLFDAWQDGSFVEKKDAYQDKHHAWLLAQWGVDRILAPYGFLLEDILHKGGNFLMLEQDLPDICADRLEYILYGAYLEKKLTRNEVQHILRHIQYENGVWFFDSVEAARLLGDASLYLTEHVFGTVQDALVYRWTARSLEHAVSIGLLSFNDIHYAQDKNVWNVLSASKDARIQSLVKCICNVGHHYELSSDGQEYDLHIRTKFRGVDPMVQTAQGLRRLTVLNGDYCDEYERVRDAFAKGFKVRLINAE